MGSPINLPAILIFKPDTKAGNKLPVLSSPFPLQRPASMDSGCPYGVDLLRVRPLGVKIGSFNDLTGFLLKIF
jgi:hypothetical protein